jgi:hypothetical protein
MSLLSRFDLSRAIGMYAAILTLGFGAFVMSGSRAPRSQHLQELNVERINVREPDGTLRMTLSSHARMPGLIIGKQEIARPDRPQAGMLFFNDQGEENGGLIFNGGLVDGKAENGGSLTFDRYRQDQTLQLLSVEDGQDRFAGLYVNDQPDAPAAYDRLARIMAMPDGTAKQAAFQSAHMGETQRAFLGRGSDKASQLVLRDGQGRKRLVLRVTENGDPTIQFLDAAGKVIRTLQ